MSLPPAVATVTNALPSLPQEALATLQKEMNRNFLEQRTLLDDIAETLESTRASDQSHKNNGIQATRFAMIPRNVKRAFPSTPSVESHRKPSEVRFRAILDSADPSDVDQARAFSRLRLEDQCSEPDNECRLAVVQSKPHGWLENYLTIIILLSRGLCEVLWSIVASDPRLLAFYTAIVAIQTRIPAIPSVDLAINDSIRLIDAFGQECRLQYTTHRYFPVFKSFLMEFYKHTPSGPYIATNRFRLLDVRASKIAPIDEQSWSSLVHPGARITLSVILTKVTANHGDICLGCGTHREWSWLSHRYACPCGLVFYRYINNEPDQIRSSTALEKDQNHVTGRHESKPETATLEASQTLTARETRRQELTPLDTRAKQSGGTGGEPILSSRNQDKIVSVKQALINNETLDLDRRHIAVFKSVILETTQSFRGRLFFHISPRDKNVKKTWRFHRDITVNSEPYTIPLLPSAKHMSGMDHENSAMANISLQLDELGNLWIQCESPEPEICVNNDPLWEIRRFRKGSSTRRRLEEGDHILVKGHETSSSFVVKTCHTPPGLTKDGCRELRLLSTPQIRRKLFNADFDERYKVDYDAAPPLGILGTDIRWPR